MPNRPLVAPQVQSISFDPAAAMQDVASIQINRQRMDDARRKSMASMRMRQLAQQYPDSPLEFVDAVTREFPEEGFALGESYWKGVKENAQAHKAQTESSVANLEVGTRILQAARQNPALYGAAKQWITKMSPEVGGQLSEHYNEQEVDGWLQTGQKTSDFLKAQADAAERLTKQDTRGSVLTLFAGASNPQQWQTAVDLTTRSGLKPLLGLVASEWSPEAQAAAAQASISPEKQADDARAAAAEARQTRQFETTEARQNREFAVTSGLARRADARAQKAAEAAATGSSENLDAVGAMVIDNPDLLKDFPAKDRSKILTHIATAGGAFPNKRKEKITQLATSALDTITQMEAHPGFSSAVGAKGLSSAFGLKGAPAEGSAAADFVRLSEALKSQVTLPNLELMKGLGAMSDREFRVVADASSALDRSMSEAGYRAELARLKKTLQGLATRPVTPPPPPPPTNTTAPAAKKKDPLGIL